jgi:transposase-like protein
VPGRSITAPSPDSEQEAIIVAFRRHTLRLLDDCLYALQATIPHLTRSSLHRCLERERHKPAAGGGRQQQARKQEVRALSAEGKLYLFVAIDRTSMFAFVELVERADRQAAARFLQALIAAVPYRIHTVLTDTASSSPICRRIARDPRPAFAAILLTGSVFCTASTTA